MDKVLESKFPMSWKRTIHEDFIYTLWRDDLIVILWSEFSENYPSMHDPISFMLQQQRFNDESGNIFGGVFLNFGPSLFGSPPPMQSSNRSIDHEYRIVHSRLDSLLSVLCYVGVYIVVENDVHG